MAVQEEELLEREAELERLTALFESAGSAVLVEGEPGIGKSVLLAAVAELARGTGFRVLTARGGELEGEFGHGLAAQLLEGEVARATPARRARLLAGAAALAAAVVGPAPAGDAVPHDPFGVQHGLYWLVANLADERPLALIVDDLQWGDSATLRFLAYLVRRLEDMPVALLAAVRTGEQTASGGVIDALRAEPLVESLELRPLGEQSVTRLVGAGLDGPVEESFTRACQEVSGGNPFLLGELLRTLADEGVEPSEDAAARVRVVGPPGISRSVLLRLTGMPPETVALAQAAAVIGDGARLREAGELAGLGEESALRAADQLADARILTTERPLEFKHPLVRTAIYSDLGAGRRARDHKQAARLLAAADAPAERVAAHLLLTEPAGDGWVVEMLGEAARRALAHGAPDAVAEYLERSLAEPPAPALRPALLRELGSARFLAGDVDGLDLHRRALELTDDAREWASTALELAPLLGVAERMPEAVELLERAMARLDPDDEVRAHISAVLVELANFDISTATELQRLLPPGASRLAGATADERRVLATLAYRTFQLGSADEAAALAERALAGGLLIDDLTTDVVRAIYAIATLILTDRFDTAAEAVERLLAGARARGSLHAINAASGHRGQLAYRRGALGEAEVSLRDAMDAAGTLGIALAGTVGVLLDVLVERGELVAARAELAAAAVDERWLETSTSPFALFFLRGRSRLHLAEGRLEAGLADALELGLRCERWSSGRAQFEWRPQAALALARLGDPERARTLAQEELQDARAFGAPRATAVALRTLALVEGGAAGLELLREAAAVIEDSQALLVKAQVLVELGAGLRRANQRQAARGPLTDGYELAECCEAAPLAARAVDELSAIGSRPRSVVRTGSAALTPSERRVCALAADGLSNPEIAQALFVTRATVESHLHSSYRKLDVGSRHDLAEALTRSGDH